MAKKKQKTVDEILEQKRQDRFSLFTVGDDKEHHSVDEVLEAGYSQGLFERPKQKVEPSNMNTSMEPSGRAIGRRSPMQTYTGVGYDYLSNYNDTTRYSDVSGDIDKLEGLKGGAARRGKNTAAYDKAIEMLKEYAGQRYSLDGTDLSTEAIQDRQKHYTDNKREINRLNEQLSLDDINSIDKAIDMVNLSFGDMSTGKNSPVVATKEQKAITNYLSQKYGVDFTKDNNEVLRTLQSVKNTVEDEQKSKNDVMRSRLSALENTNRVYERSHPEDFIESYNQIKNDPDFSPVSFSDIVNSDSKDKLTVYTKSHYDDYSGYNPSEISNIVSEGDVNNWGYISKSEKDIYYNLLNKEGEEKAYEYLNSLAPILKKRETEAGQERYQRTADAMPLRLGSFALAPVAIAGGISSFVDDGIKLLKGEEIDPNNYAHHYTNMTDAVMQSDVDAIEDATGGANLFGFSLGDAYQGVYSGYKSMLLTVLTNPTIASLVLSTDAAQSKATELYDRGATNGQIAVGSAAAGLFEYVFEKISLDKIVEKVAENSTKKGVAKYITNALMSAGIEGTEEVNTEIANYIADQAIMQDQSERQTLINQYKADGLSEKEAKAKANEAFAQKLYQSFMGGVVGGAAGGTGMLLSASNEAVQNIKEKHEYNQYSRQAGQGIVSNANVDALIEKARQTGDEALVAQADALEKLYQSDNVSEKKLKKEAGKLYASMQESTIKNVDEATAKRAEIKRAFAEQLRGNEAVADVEKASEALTKDYFSDKLTRSEKAIVSTGAAQEAKAAIKENEDILTEQAQKSQQRAYEDYMDTHALTQAQEKPKESAIDTSDYHQSADGATYFDGDFVKVKDIASVGADSVTVNLDNGKTADVKKMDLSSEDDAVIYQSIVDIQKSLGQPISRELANEIYHGYDSDVYQNATDYILGVRDAIEKGYSNETLMKSDDPAVVLAPAARDVFYRAGRNIALGNTAQRQSNITAQPSATGKGSVTFEGGDIKKVLPRLNGRRRVAVDLMTGLAEAKGLDVVFFESKKDGKGRWNSKYANAQTGDTGAQSPNGFYKNGKIYIDINSGTNGQGLILFTASHELVHMIREYSPEMYQELADFLVEKYNQKGISVRTLVLREMAKSTNLNYDEALEEVIANSCESFLRDVHLNDKAAELYRSNPTLANKIRDYLHDLLSRLKKWYSGLTPQSVEGRTVAAMRDEIQHIHDLFVKGINQASQNRLNAKKAATEDGARYDLRENSDKSENNNFSKQKYQSRSDADYLSAVENGDMETAQRMVDEAAEAAGYDRHLYHGAKAGGGFNVFKGWQYFTGNKAYAERYTQRDTGKGLYDVYVKTDRLFDTRKADDRTIFEQYKNEYGMSELQENGLPDWTDGYDLSDIIEENGLDYDGIVLDEGGDLIDGKPVSRGLSYVIRDSSQVKSAEPVTYDDNGDVVPLSERFNTEQKDIRYQRRDSRYDFSLAKDLDTLDDKALKVYNKRGWAYSLFSDEDMVLLHEKFDEYSQLKTRNRDDILPDGIMVTDVNNKMLLIGGNRNSPEVYGVLVINADNEYRALSTKTEVFTNARDNANNYRQLSRALEFMGYDRGAKNVRYYSAEDFYHIRGQHQDRATLPGDFENFGYVKDYEIGRRLREEAERTGSVKFQSRDEDFDLDFLFDDDDSIENTFAKEYATHHEDIGEVLRNISDIDITPKKVAAIVNRVLRDNLGSVNAKARELLSTELQIALDRVSRENPETIVNEMIDAVRTAVSDVDVTDDRAAANYSDLLSAFKGRKFYLTDEQISQLAEHDMTLNDFRKKMFGYEITIVSRENAKRSIDGGYADATELSLEGLYDMLESPEEFLPFRREQWDEYGYDAPYILMETLDNLRDMRTRPLDEAYSGEYVDDMAVALTAKITGAIVEAKYNSKQNPYVTKLVDDLKQKRTEAVKKQKEKNRQKLAELRQKERARAEKREQEIRQNYREQRAKGYENRKRTEYRGKVKQLIGSFNTMLTHPVEGKYIPRGFVSQTIDILNAINIDSRRSERLSAAIADLKVKYEGLKADETGYASYNSAMDERLRVLSEMIEAEAEEWVPKRNKAIAYENKRAATEGKPLKRSVTSADFSIQNMSLELLQYTYETLNGMRTVIKESMRMTGEETRKMRQQITDTLISEIKGVRREHTNMLTAYGNLHKSGYIMFKSFADYKKNSEWENRQNELNKGQLETSRLEIEFSKPTLELIADKKNLDKMLHTKVDVGLKDADGNPVMVTHDMLVHIYLDLSNEHNAGHVTGDGYHVPDLDLYYKGKRAKSFEGANSKLASGPYIHAVELSQRMKELDIQLNTALTNGEDIISIENEIDKTADEIKKLRAESDKYLKGLKQAVESKMTAYDYQWVEAWREFNDMATPAINNVTMQTLGFKKAVVENYFPVTVDKSFRAPDFDTIVSDMSLENWGSLKERVKGAKGAIVLQGITDVMADRIHKTALYCGMTIPIQNFRKVYGGTQYNFTEKKEGDDFKTSVQRELDKKFGTPTVGDSANVYIKKLIADLIESRNNSDNGADKLLALARGGIAVSTLTANPRVWLVQAASLVSALPELDIKSVIKGTATIAYKWNPHYKQKGAATRLRMSKVTPLYDLRRMGLVDTELGDITKQRSSKASKAMAFTQKIANLTQKVDSLTTGRIWFMCEYWVKDHKPNVREGTIEFDKAVAEKYNQVIERTQPNYTPMQRGQILRSKNSVTKLFTMWQTQRMQNVNMLFDAVGTLNRTIYDYKHGLNGVNRNDLKTAWYQAGKTTLAFLVSNAMIVAIQAATDILIYRKFKRYADDDDDLTTESVLYGILLNYISTLTGNFFGGSELEDMISAVITGERYNEINPGLLGTVIEDVASVVKTAQALKSDGVLSADFLTNLNTAITNWCGVFGIPARNIEKLYDGVVGWIEKLVEKDLFQFSEIGSHVNKALNARAVSKIVKGDYSSVSVMTQDKYDEAYIKAWNKGKAEEKCQSAGRTAAKKAITSLVKETYLSTDDFETKRSIREYMYKSGYYVISSGKKKGQVSLDVVDNTLDSWKNNQNEKDQEAETAKQRKNGK